jgi:hypothetical protein
MTPVATPAGSWPSLVAGAITTGDHGASRVDAGVASLPALEQVPIVMVPGGEGGTEVVEVARQGPGEDSRPHEQEAEDPPPGTGAVEQAVLRQKARDDPNATTTVMQRRDRRRR